MTNPAKYTAFCYCAPTSTTIALVGAEGVDLLEVREVATRVGRLATEAVLLDRDGAPSVRAWVETNSIITGVVEIRHNPAKSGRYADFADAMLRFLVYQRRDPWVSGERPTNPLSKQEVIELELGCERRLIAEREAMRHGRDSAERDAAALILERAKLRETLGCVFGSGPLTEVARQVVAERDGARRDLATARESAQRTLAERNQAREERDEAISGRAADRAKYIAKLAADQLVIDQSKYGPSGDYMSVRQVLSATPGESLIDAVRRVVAAGSKALEAHYDAVRECNHLRTTSKAASETLFRIRQILGCGPSEETEDAARRAAEQSDLLQEVKSAIAAIPPNKRAALARLTGF